ncbi:helix-turn-helix domain-containing protein [Spirosoma endbachense]|uniref:Helix-turn-helix domain-containing protein n=1 Tax=Spirosoma endbachense TaxID=2666025 RepID=A0A6P1VMR8_9BACT|nr:AraC family transcriptional regulator [Spirosoma endbachense]QHV93995.1 helix-turn-helix domain-containing protein [Spirosoma endbachense]
MEKNIVIFKNLHETYQTMDLPVSGIETNAEFTINNLKALHPQLPFKSIGFRPDYFSFLFVKNAKGQYTTDDVTFATEPGTIYFTNPGHFKSFEWYEIDEVYLITFSESFLRENVHPDIFREFPFLLAETVYPKVLKQADFAEFETLYRQIEKEYHAGSPYKNRIIGNFFVVLLLKIKEYFWNDYNPIYEGNRSSQIVKTFKRNLENHFRELVTGKVHQPLRVQDYADKQSLHVNYLSNVITSKTGKSVSTWIAEKTIAEARTLLQNASMSIKEVSNLLGFSEATHFSNYFKKHTAMSPADYRKQLLKS